MSASHDDIINDLLKGEKDTNEIEKIEQMRYQDQIKGYGSKK